MNLMGVLDLRALHKLHQIDEAIVEIKKRAAAMDPGRAIQAAIQQAEAAQNVIAEPLHALQVEQKELELRNQSIREKLRRIDGELYGGKVVNPREVENLNKEIETLKGQIDKNEDRLLALIDEIPALEAKLPPYDEAIARGKKKLAEHQKSLVELRSQLESEFKTRSAQRPAALEGIPALMLNRYEEIRKKAGGIGMADVKGRSCGMCGTLLPEKSIEFAKEGRIVSCESCNRILYATDGLI
jgi:uncharacterized protein